MEGKPGGPLRRGRLPEQTAGDFMLKNFSFISYRSEAICSVAIIVCSLDDFSGFLLHHARPVGLFGAGFVALSGWGSGQRQTAARRREFEREKTLTLYITKSQFPSLCHLLYFIQYRSCVLFLAKLATHPSAAVSERYPRLDF